MKRWMRAIDDAMWERDYRGEDEGFSVLALLLIFLLTSAAASVIVVATFARG